MNSQLLGPFHDSEPVVKNEILLLRMSDAYVNPNDHKKQPKFHSKRNSVSGTI